MTDTWFVKRENGKTIHNWLSNFWIEPDGTNVESEFQAAKHLAHPWRRATILHARPGRAKKLGRKWPLNDRELAIWNDNKIAVMRTLVQQKTLDHPEIAMALISTGDANLCETNWWHDNFWGNCTCLRCFRSGDNNLGKIWMAVRNDLAGKGR